MTEHTDRDALRKLADAATPGPWVVEYDNEDDYEQGIAYGPFPSSLHGPESLTKWDDPRWQAEYGHHVSEVSDMRAEDAEFIAAARTAVPALLDALDQAEARIKAVRDVLDQEAPDPDIATRVRSDMIRRALDGV